MTNNKNQKLYIKNAETGEFWTGKDWTQDQKQPFFLKNPGDVAKLLEKIPDPKPQLVAVPAD